MKSIKLKVGGRTFELAYTLDAMCELMDAIPDFDMDKFSDYARNPRQMLDLLMALAIQGEKLAGRTLDVDKAWFGSHISPAPISIAKVQAAIFEALVAGMTMETDTGEEGEVDVVLEQLKKKEKKES